MKDAGDFKGLSLLQAMQETGGLPTSKAGFIQKVLDMAVERGEKLIVGTPEEQTRALLQSLKKPQTAKPTTPKTTPKASSGDKANKINQSNSGIQPNTTPSTPKGKGIKLNSGFVNPGALFEKSPIKINNIVRRMTPADARFIQDFQDAYSSKKLTKEMKDKMDTMLGEMKLTAKDGDEMATIGQLLLEVYNVKK